MADFTDKEIEHVQELASLLEADFEIDGYCLHLHFFSYTIFIRKNYNSSKSKFSFMMKQDFGKSFYDSIQMNLERPVRSLMKDLKRRLLNNGHEWASEKRAEHAKNRAGKDRARLLSAEILAANGCKISEVQQSNGRIFGHNFHLHNIYQVSDKGNETIYADIRLNSVAAMKMVAAICEEDYQMFEAEKIARQAKLKSNREAMRAAARRRKRENEEAAQKKESVA